MQCLASGERAGEFLPGAFGTPGVVWIFFYGESLESQGKLLLVQALGLADIEAELLRILLSAQHIGTDNALRPGQGTPAKLGHINLNQVVPIHGIEHSLMECHLLKGTVLGFIEGILDCAVPAALNQFSIPGVVVEIALRYNIVPNTGSLGILSQETGGFIALADIALG